MKKQLKLKGATCPSCRYAIQHTGAKVKGVNKIEIDPMKDIIDLDYSGDEDSVGKIQDLVEKLGYSADVL